MQYKIFSLPFSGDVEREEEMNLFLRQHRIVNVAREITNVNGNSFWTFCIEYLENGTSRASPGDVSSKYKGKKSKIDYREVLSEEDFVVFAALRDWRRDVGRQVPIPIYLICTNEQFSFFAQNRPQTRADLLKAPGFGEGKADSYGEAILEIVKKFPKKEETTDKKEGNESCDASAD